MDEVRAAAQPQWPPGMPAVISRKRERSTSLGLRVLCVEDDEQTLSVLAALLEHEGYEVATAVTAAQGLELLRNGRFQLVVSDYWLPDKTGAWMVRHAAETNLLGDARVLMVTAEHRPQGVENLRVLAKPLDLDEFLAIVNDELEPARETELAKARKEREQNSVADAQAKIELVLYVSASSPSSLKAVRNLDRILSSYDSAAVRYTLCDLSKDPGKLADEDHIAFTPTLVKRSPHPKIWVLGDLERTDIVHDLLATSGVDRTR